ncbi:MAG: hypothetical protein J0I77_10960 [Rudaea sp.]|uniref:hypothetical protein n=1 Tax=unclassified Rudaea TaxID=2627037 RepID=UPI001484E47A|nr:MULTISPECIES: hypothetical protein [unclassified Rudaea]MBN8886232.1 hypothetical protein [Rudaea sp.]MBR0346071.1 hypothetical protein [Rudaea sp.]
MAEAAQSTIVSAVWASTLPEKRHNNIPAIALAATALPLCKPMPYPETISAKIAIECRRLFTKLSITDYFADA